MGNKILTKEGLEEHDQKEYENSRDSTESMKKHTSYLVTQLDKYPSLENRKVVREDLKRLEEEANRSYRYALGDIRHNYGASENTSRAHYEAERDYDNKMSYIKRVENKISQQLEKKIVGGLKDVVYRTLKEAQNKNEK